MIQLEIDKKDLDNIKKSLDRVSPKSRSGVLVRAFRLAAAQVEKGLKENLSNKILSRRTGQLANSIQSRIDTNKQDIEAVIGSGTRSGMATLKNNGRYTKGRLPYANIHEDGGTVTAKKAKFLWIPEVRNLTSVGVMRITPRMAIDRGAFIRGNGVYLRYGKSDKSVYRIFTLKKSVHIPGRKYLSKTAAQQAQNVIKIIEQGIEEALK